MKYPKRTIRVKASDVGKAIRQAERFCPRDWQAELLEILRIPSVYRRWRYINSDRMPGLELSRHKGKGPFVGGREVALAVEDWLIFNGYELGYGCENYCWNRARSDFYGHSPSSAWDGVRRETYAGFADALRLAYSAATEGRSVYWRTEQTLWDYRILFINDLEGG